MTLTVVDPFSVKQYPKWHPYRLCYTAGARWAEARSRSRFAEWELPEKRLSDLPAAPAADWHDTDVNPEQLRHLLAGLRDTESLAGTVCVEVGAFRGVTAAALAAATPRAYVAIDPYIGYGGSESDFHLMRSRTAGLANFWHERSTSGHAAAAWARGPIGFAFIDAVHDYMNVRFDIAAWSAHVVPGAILAFHDTDNPAFAGVRRAVRNICPPWQLYAHVPDLVMLRKP